MKKFKHCIYGLLLPVLMAGCTKIEDGDTSFVTNAPAPKDGSLVFKVSNDNSGQVSITPHSAGAMSYAVHFGDATPAPEQVQAGKSVTHVYKEGVFAVKAEAKGVNGAVTTISQQLTVTYRAPENLTITAPVNGSQVSVSATAQYASGGFNVYFGDVPNETPVLIANGASVNHTYTAPGEYTVKVVALSGGAAKTEGTQKIRVYKALALPMTFEDPNVNYNWGDFGGSATTVIPNPSKTGINTSATVGKIIKRPPEVWAGNYIILSQPIDFTSNKKFKVKIYAPRAGMRIWFQLERSGNNAFKEAKEAKTTVANAWEELVFDFTGVITDNSKQLQNILFFLDDGTVGDGSANYTILFDDITLTN